VRELFALESDSRDGEFELEGNPAFTVAGGAESSSDQ
jgi:hypothetical protein